MDEARYVAIGLAAAGFGRGDPEIILGMPADLVLDMTYFQTFQSDYSATSRELNKERK